ncbi:MAG: bifunctional phosphoribosyl-AMP cyclohydrolase/phosphoribosyl-ATP diphosphatase HisIE [Lachnospiraceae bacterium]|nr:bifunctional phosphoribosyl-AMP cyclohydrolase/phosphoribosyl-ATP diphosphatase HisIE [Lachnospiraceae bacterium]
MYSKELVVPVYLKNGKAAASPADDQPYGGGDAAALAVDASNHGADAILVFDFSSGDAQHDAAIAQVKEMARAVDLPIYGGGNVRRMEDVKKLIYAGCQKVFLNYAKEGNVELTHEVSSKFGKEKILACVRTQEELAEAVSHGPLLGGIVTLSDLAFAKKAVEAAQEYDELPVLAVPAWDASGADAQETQTNAVRKKEDGTAEDETGSGLGQLTEEEESFLRLPAALGLCCGAFQKPEFEFMELKHQLKENGIAVNTYESSISWDELKKNNDGMVPVVVQDYKTQEVLMVAYMNQEAFETTVRSGRMTYFSRSRQELWVKGLTSGHFQYVKELQVDCDNDTLLAKVHQIGAACHTGNRSCFYRTILKKEYDETNPLKVFEDVYGVIEDRKIHPKEGSYTNYLFDKGIDKILKKVGEEATEIIIAAKNPDPEEIKYEISDFLYHVMVLMAERGVTWEDITKELARR